MQINDLWSLIQSDYYRYRAVGGDKEGSLLGVVLFSQGFWASTVYRLTHFLNKRNWSIFRPMVLFFALSLQKLIEILTLIRIPFECEVGRGLYIGHFGPIVIHSKTRIGDFCNLSQGVTIGAAHRGKRKGVPWIGNRVYIGPHAILIGDIRIGDDVAIGAGAVVVESAPDRAVLAGNPAKAVSRKGSFDMVTYRGMERDLERIQSQSQHLEKIP